MGSENKKPQEPYKTAPSMLCASLSETDITIMYYRR